MDNNDMNHGYEPTEPNRAIPATGRTTGRTTARGRLLAGAAAAAVLAGGVAFGAVTMLSGSPASAATGPTGQAAVLNTALTTADNPATAASTAGTSTSASTAGHKHKRRPLGRLRRLGGVDGQFTFETKTGPKTLAFERGTIASVAGSDVVVRAKNGATWTWTLVSDSVVREQGKKASASALASGESVFVGGPVISGAHDARLIVVRAPHQASVSS